MQITIKLSAQKEIPIIGIKKIDQIYAEDFVNKGIIHFSNPKIWRDDNICNGEQLDKDEGCFCYSTEENDKQFESIGRHFVKNKYKEGWKYYEDTDYIVGTCLYGVLKSDFKDSITKYGVKSIPSEDFAVPSEFFTKFNNDSNYKVVVIFDLYRFCNMLENAITKLGAAKEEVYFSSVFYVNKMVPYCVTEPFPFEYFLKNESFSKQSELRIIVASKNKLFFERLKNNDNNIEIGNISAFSIIQDDYNSDLFFSIQGNQLLYNLATPKVTNLDELDFNTLIADLYQIKQNMLPGEPKEKAELDKIADPIVFLIRQKYGVEFKDDWRLYNVPKKLYDDLPVLFQGLCASIVLDNELP